MDITEETIRIDDKLTKLKGTIIGTDFNSATKTIITAIKEVCINTYVPCLITNKYNTIGTIYFRSNTLEEQEGIMIQISFTKDYKLDSFYSTKVEYVNFIDFVD